ncbi:unnamed protein product [Macrosiphum euphorbiae]|uniref:Carboxylesterase type B domain-containing protein n=1 Tax=Macrosiphum euphorbiae TaxID=13131 RepID=A0AAV0X329_9HEMI|nr:unnamed protein product [Macrosiphum euphorbiae]
MVPPWWLLVAFVFGGVSAALTSSRVVRTKYGDVSGVIVTPDNRRLDAVEVFRGVPYASPPVGSLRFMPPVTGSLWSGVKVADRFGPVCPQRLPNVSDETAALKTMARGRMQYLRRLLPYLQNQSEDCLYLNIYAPAQGKCIAPPPPPKKKINPEIGGRLRRVGVWRSLGIAEARANPFKRIRCAGFFFVVE